MIDKIIKEGEKYGDVNVILSRNQSLEIGFVNREIASTNEGDTLQLAIRISKNKKFGYATTSDISKWRECLSNAVKIMKVSKELEQKIHLAEPQKFRKVEGIFSKRVLDLPPEKIISKGYKMMDEIDEKLGVPDISISKSFEEVQIANSNGVNAKEKETTFSVITEVNYKDVNARELHISHDLFDIKKIGKEASRLCLESINPKPIPTFRGSVILDYFAFSGLLETVLIPAVSADEIHAKRSFLHDKFGKKVFSEKLTITDNGILKNGLMSGGFDLEGISKQKTKVIDAGVFVSPLYDIYSAKKENKKSTGNCGGINKVPLISPTNFVILPGDYSRNEMIQETKEGIIAKEVFGLHLINKLTGDCSIGVESAFYIKNGEIKFPIKQAMINFNLFEELKKLDVLGKELRQESSVVAPTIKCDNVQIIG